MKPVEFKGQNLVLGKGQPQYLELPVFRCEDLNGTVWACWELDDNDLADLTKHRKLWLGQLTFNIMFQPQLVTTQIPLEVAVAMTKLKEVDNVPSHECMPVEA